LRKKKGRISLKAIRGEGKRETGGDNRLLKSLLAKGVGRKKKQPPKKNQEEKKAPKMHIFLNRLSTSFLPGSKSKFHPEWEGKEDLRFLLIKKGIPKHEGEPESSRGPKGGGVEVG